MMIIGNNWLSFIWIENPLKLWMQCKDVFVAPHITIEKWNIDDTDAKILDIRVSGLGWKEKYGYLEYEYPPFIELSLFKKWKWIMRFDSPHVKDSTEFCYWEGMLSYIYKNNKDLVKTYQDNIWESKDNNHLYTIMPYLTHSAWTKLVKTGVTYNRKEEAN